VSARVWRTGGVHINCGMYEEAYTQELGKPHILSCEGFFLQDLMRSTLTGKAAAMGWRIKRSTLRQGKPATRRGIQA
jgi:hypothetical protein